jgi:hypothetical protein
MYSMLAMRQVLISSLLFAIVPPATIQAASNGAQYVGGTVKSIPVNADGTLDFSDPKEFRFNYEGAVYQLPYAQITGTDVESADVRHVLHVIPRESMLFSHRKRTLVINFKDAGGTAGTLNFELMAYRAAEAKEAITSKQNPVTAFDAIKASNEWWGDSVWRTKRNQAAWDARAAQANQEAQAAQNASSSQTAQAVGTK